MATQIIDFDRDGWKVERRPDGRMQITGRSPRNTQHALFDIMSVEDPGEPGKPTVAINADGQRYELVKAPD